jgi:hypothetical protein
VRCGWCCSGAWGSVSVECFATVGSPIGLLSLGVPPCLNMSRSSLNVLTLGTSSKRLPFLKVLVMSMLKHYLLNRGHDLIMTSVVSWIFGPHAVVRKWSETGLVRLMRGVSMSMSSSSRESI